MLKQPLNKKPASKKPKPKAKLSRENLKDIFLIGALIVLPFVLLLSSLTGMQIEQWRGISGLLNDNPEVLVVSDEGLIWLLLILLPAIFICALSKFSPATPIPKSERKEQSPLVHKIKNGVALLGLMTVTFTLNETIPGATLNFLSKEPYTECFSWKSSMSMRAPTHTAFARTEQACDEFIAKYKKQDPKPLPSYQEGATSF